MQESAQETGGPPVRTSEGAELARGALFNFVAMMASNLRGIFTFLIARILGGAALGTFAVAWSTTDLISKIGTFGLENGTLAFVARSQIQGNPARSKRLLRSGVGWGLGISGITAVLAIGALQLFGPQLGQPLGLLQATSYTLLALPGLALYRISNGVSRGMKVMDHDIYSRGLTEALGTTAIFLLGAALGLRELAPVVAAVLGTAASGLVAYALARSLFRNVPDTADREPLAAQLLGFSAPIALYSMLNIFIMRMDVILLQFYVGRAPGVSVETVGIYAAAVELGGALRKVRQAFDPILMPIAAAQAVASDIKATEQSFAALARWLLAIVLPVLCLFALAGGEILSLYGSGFERGGTWLAIIGAACAINAFVGLAETIILVHHPKLNLLNSSVTVILALACNLYLIPTWGATGAALGMLVPYTLQGFLRHVELRHYYGWRWPWRALNRPVLASVAAMLPALALRAWIPGVGGALAAGVMFSAAYLGVWRVLGLDTQDRAILSELRRGRKRP